MTKLSKDFDSSEFVCPCCNGGVVSEILIDKLQQLRDLINKPITITSGYRCSAYNKKIGGYANSPHCKGLAADIYCKGMDIYVLAGRADLIFSRIGIYPDNNFIHVDIVKPHPSKFWVRHKGVYKYFKPPHNHYDDVYYYLLKKGLLANVKKI